MQRRNIPAVYRIKIYSYIIMPGGFGTGFKMFSKGKYRKATKVLKRKGKRTTVNLTRAVGPIAPRIIVKLKYTNTHNRTSTLGVPDNYQWNLNSIFDPERTGTGHQPYGHDTYQSLYNRYRVIKASWRLYVTPHNTTADYNRTVVAVVTPQNGSGTFSDLSLASEVPRAITKMTDVGTTLLFKGAIGMAKLNGQTPSQYLADDRFQALFGADPAEILTLNCAMAHPTVDHTVDCDYHMTISYTVEVWDPKTIAQS